MQIDGTRFIGTRPILVSLWAHSLSVATLVVLVSDGVDVWVALRFFMSLIYHLHSVSTPGAGVTIVKKKKILEQPITKFKLALLVGYSLNIVPECRLPD